MTANAPKSKKRSGASSLSPPKRIVFSPMRTWAGTIVPNALRHAGEEVIAFHERFASGTEDSVWLHEVGRNGWILLTKDSRIRYRSELDSGAAFIEDAQLCPGEQQSAWTRNCRYLCESASPYETSI